MTNRERFIKNLSNEKLAYLIPFYCGTMDSCLECPLKKLESCSYASIERIVKWLEEEVKE